MMGETGPTGLHSKGRKTDMKTAAKRERKTLRIVELALLLGAAAFLMTGVWALNTQRDLADKVVRLHVLANSDTEEDQALKLLVRDAVLERAISGWLPIRDLNGIGTLEAFVAQYVTVSEAEAETDMDKAVTAVFSGKTLLVIAHRLSTIQNADQIVVLEKGSVADCGTQEELLGRCPLYQTLWTAHVGARNWAVTSGKKEGN